MLLSILMTKENKKTRRKIFDKTARKADGGVDGVFRVKLFGTSLYSLFMVGSLQ